MATIRKRGTRWQVQVRRYGFSSQSRSFSSKAEAEAWGRAQEARMDRGEAIAPVRLLRRWRVRDILDRYTSEVVPLKRGHGPEEMRLRRMVKTPLADVSLADLRPEMIALYRDERLGVVTGATVRRELAILQHAFEMARKDWGIPLNCNPVAAVRKPPASKPRTRRVEGSDWEALEEGLARTRNSLVRDVILFALATGMRRGEILGLQWRDIDDESRTARLHLTKNGNGRDVPLGPTAVGILTMRWEGIATEGTPSPSSLVFPISANAVRLAWSRLLKRSGVDDLRFHDLRHEAVSRFFELGLTLPEVGLISGHRDARMLLRYTHLRPGSVAKKLATLQRGS